MRHKKHKYKLNVDPAHRKAMVKNLAVSLLDHGAIKTTHARAKAVQSYIEKLVTVAKKDSVANRRLAFSRLNNKKSSYSAFRTSSKVQRTPRWLHTCP